MNIQSKLNRWFAFTSLAKSTTSFQTLLVAVVMGLAISSSHAATRNWDGDTSAAWATAGNWDTLPADSTATDIANFNLATYGGNPVYAPNAGTRSINGITIGSGNGAMTLTTTTLTIGGSGITIANGAGALTVSGAVTIGAAQPWSNNDNDTATFGVINHNGTAGTKLSLAGNFRFTGVNTGKGGITINSGTLEIGSAGKLYGTYNASGPVVTVGSGATLRVNGWGWDTVGGPGQLDANRGFLVVNGGTIEFAGSTGNNASTAEENFTIGTGGATLKNTTAGQTWTLVPGTFGDLINNTGLTVGGAGNGSISKIISGTGALTKTDGGTWTLSGVNTYTGHTTVSGGTLKITGAGRIYSPTYNGAAVVTVQTGGVLELDTWGYGAALSLGQLAYESARIVINNGKIRMNGTTAYERGVTVQAGGATFEAAAGANWNHQVGIAANSYVYTGNPSLTFTGAGAGTFAKVFSGSGSLTKSGAGTWTLSSQNTYTGGTTISDGILTLGHATDTLANGGAINVNGGTLALGGNSDTVGAVTLTSGSITGSGGTLTGTGSDYDVRRGTISAKLGGSVGLTKTTGDTVTLSGVNSYTGTTTVNAGTLQLGANDVIPDASKVSIGTATLDADTRTDTAGTLTVTGAAVINLGSGAALAFADSKSADWTGGTLNITGTLGATSLRFGDSADDLTSGTGSQLAKISVNGSGLGAYILDANGYLVLDPPHVVTLNPADNTLNVAETANLVVTFDRTVSKGTGNIEIRKTSDNSVIATIDVTSVLVTVSGAEVTINPSADLPSATECYVLIAAGAFTASAPFAGITVATTWSFKTAGAPPTLTSIVDNKSGGPIAANTVVTYTVTFSEDMDAGTVSDTDFSNAGGSADVTIGAVTETSANSGVFTVPVTPTSGGTLRLQINAGVELKNVFGIDLVTTSALQDNTTITVDAAAPSPDPMTFASPPSALTPTSITMTGTTATDPSGVEYFFACTGGGGPDSGWQNSAVFTPTGLAPSTTYSYTVRARDAVLNATAASAPASATTLAVPRNLYSSGTKPWDTTTANWGVVSGGPYNTDPWNNAMPDSAIFEGAAGTVTLGEPISIGNLTFTHTTGTYTLTGSALNFTGGTITASNPSGAGNVATILSNITGSPAINLKPMDNNEQFTLNPAASGSMIIGAVSGDSGDSSEKLILQGGVGSAGTIASVSGPKVIVWGGSWTLSGASSGRDHEVSGGTLTLNANLSATKRAVILSGTGVINYNVANAVSASAASNISTDNGFRITGGTLDQTSGSAINANASTTDIDLGGTLTFLGSKGANSSLHLGNGPVWLKDGNRQITVTDAATTLTIGGVIQDDDTPGRGLTKAGAGTLELRGNNTYSGVTTISTGFVTIAHANALGTTAGNTTIAATGSSSTGGILKLSGGITTAENITITGATETSGFTPVISGSGTLSGTITLSNLTGGIRFGGVTFSGTITQTVSTQPIAFQGTTVNNVINNNGGGLAIYTSTTILKGVSGTGIGSTSIDQGGTLQLGITDALNTGADLNVGLSGSTTDTFDLASFGQTVRGLISASGGTRRVINSVAATTSTLTVGNGGSDYTFSGTILDNAGTGGTVALVKTGAGNQILSGINTYTGGTRIDNGILTLDHATDTLADTGAINVSGGTLALGGNSDTVGAVTLTSGSITGSGAGTLTGTGSAYDVRSGTISAKLGGTVGLTKSTPGTVTLSGVNSYSGNTTVSEGKLLVNGSITGTVTVDSGAYLGGSGAITGNVTYANGAFGFFANDATLWFTGPVTLNGNTAYLTLPNNLPVGNYLLATNTTSGFTGSFTTTPAISSGSFVAGTAQTITTTGDSVVLQVTLLAVASKLAITDVNSGVNPTAGVPYGVTIQAQDAEGGPQNVSEDTGITLSMDSGTAGSLGGTLTGTILNGQNSVTISGVTNRIAEVFTLQSATSSGMSLVAGTTNYPIVAGPAAALSVTGFPSAVLPGAATNLTVTALDACGNTDVNYVGTVTLSSTLGGASSDPVSPYTFLAGDAGVKTFSVALNTLGLQDLTASGTGPGSPSGQQTAILVVVPTSFYWTNSVSGNWSVANNWTNDLGWVASPVPAGQKNYTLSFNNAGTYTATHNLDSGFLLNQLNFGGATATLAGNSLTLTNNDAILPQVNQNSAAAISIGNDLILGTDTTFGGTGAGTVTVAGAMSGAGGLTKTGSSTLMIGSTNNTYSGATVISGGLAKLDDSWRPKNLPGLAAWYDASDTNTVLRSGSSVTNWLDKSGNGYHSSQATSTLRPQYQLSVLNGLPVVMFDGTDDVLPITGTFSMQNVFVVLNADDGGTFANWRWPFGGWTSGANKFPAVYAFSTGTDLYSGDTTYLNGTTAGSGHVNFAPLSTYKILGGIRSSASGSRADWRIGNGDAPWKGGIAEILVTSGTMTTGDRQKVEGYLAWKWGLQANLPTDHPFKNGPPGEPCLPPSTPVAIASAGTFDLNGARQTITSLSDSGGSGGLVTNSSSTSATLTINPSSGSTTFSGAIRGPISLVKDGIATQVLAGASAYAGGTTVSNGTLLVNGSITGAVSVISGATLGGMGGAITGNVTLATGALALFTNNAPLSFSGPVTLHDNTVYLALPDNLAVGDYLLATNTTGEFSGTFNATPVLASGSTLGSFRTVTTDASAVRLIVAGADTLPPSPDPMTFAVAPAKLDDTSIVMTATTASDISTPVEYFFENTSNSANSGWITSTVWTNTGLTVGMTCGYTVKARDSLYHETAVSSEAVATIQPRSAITVYWDGPNTGGVGDGDGASQGGTATWSTSIANWDNVTARGGWYNYNGTDTAILGGTAGTVTLGEPISIGNLTFTHTTGTYTLTGSTLNFTGGTITGNTPPNDNSVGAVIKSNITGSPALNLKPIGGDEQFTLNPAASGSMSIGVVSGDGGLGSERLNLQGGAGSSGTIAGGSGGNKFVVTAGAWTLNGAATGYGHEISGGTLTLKANLNASNRAVILSGTGVINYNVANAVSASAASNISTDNGFRITGGTLDQTSGAAINTNVSTTDIDLGGTLTFLGSNGANSDLHLGSGVVWLKDGNRQITVVNPATTLTIGGVIQDDDTPGRGLSKAGAGTLELRGVNSYTGATTINAGTLLIKSGGSLHASSAVAVDGGTLGGNGTINGSVTVGGAGSIAPSAPGTSSVGTLSIVVGLNVSAMANGGSGKLKFDLDAPLPAVNNDKIAVTGTLTIGSGVLGLSDFDFTRLAGFGVGTYTLITSGGINSGDTLHATDYTAVIGILRYTLQIKDNNIELVVSPVSGTVYSIR